MAGPVGGRGGSVNPASRAARDRWAESAFAQAQRCDDRLRGLDVALRVDGGVAHVDGRVPDQDARARVREHLVGLRDVHAVWDGLLVGDQQRLRVLDVGCGATKQRDGSWGLDVSAHEGVDVVGDLTRLPFAPGSLDRVYAVHVLEHLLDLVSVMAVLHRTLAPGGVLHLMSPRWDRVNAYADPTHVKYLDVQTVKYFCTTRPGSPPWFPLCAGTDGDNVLADLTPVQPGQEAGPEQLGRFFD